MSSKEDQANNNHRHNIRIRKHYLRTSVKATFIVCLTITTTNNRSLEVWPWMPLMGTVIFGTKLDRHFIMSINITRFLLYSDKFQTYSIRGFYPYLRVSFCRHTAKHIPHICHIYHIFFLLHICGFDICHETLTNTNIKMMKIRVS